MRRLVVTVLAASAVTWTASACVRDPAIAVSPVAQSPDLGAIQLEVHDANRVTQGINGASVEWVTASREDWNQPLPHVLTDTTGRAVIAGLPPARYAIRVWATGYDTVTQRINVKAGKVEPLPVRLRSIACTPVVTARGPVCM
jgi:hypothetical protein